MISHVFKYSGKYKKKTIMAMIVMTVGVLLSVLPYLFAYQLIEPLLNHQKLEVSFAISRTLLLFACLFMYRVLYCYGLQFSHEGAFYTLKNIREYVQSRIERMPLGKIQDIGTGQLKKMFTDDIDGLELLLAHALPEGFANALGVIVLCVTMFVVDVRMALLSLASLVVSMIVMFVMFGSCVKKMNEYYASAARMNNTIIEYINGMEVIKVFNRNEESFKKYRQDIASYRDYTLGWYKLCWPFLAITTSLFSCMTVLSLPAGVKFINDGTLTISQFALVICLTISIVGPLLKVGSFGSTLPQIRFKVKTLEELTEGESLKVGEKNFQGTKHDINFENVRFSYKSQEVIHGISLDIKDNSMTAFVGESGSGKSTLAKLLVHFYDIDSGCIKIGGQDITSISLEELNNQISFVSQEQFLFNTTIYENILIGKPKASREEVLEAAQRAQCMEFLNKLPEGIDSKVGDSGKMLSGGERQRIALARAILKNSPIIVLDEATAFIDPENEEKMNKAISHVIQDKTVIIIAHRLPSIVSADQIVVLNNGNIVAKGSHKELLEKCDEYKKMWSAQKGAQEWKIKEDA